MSGLNDTNSLNLVECYDPQTDEWSELTSMAYNRDGHAVTVLDGLIYAIGNFDIYFLVILLSTIRVLYITHVIHDTDYHV